MLKMDNWEKVFFSILFAMLEGAGIYGFVVHGSIFQFAIINILIVGCSLSFLRETPYPAMLVLFWFSCYVLAYGTTQNFASFIANGSMYVFGMIVLLWAGYLQQKSKVNKP